MHFHIFGGVEVLNKDFSGGVNSQIFGGVDALNKDFLRVWGLPYMLKR